MIKSALTILIFTFLSPSFGTDKPVKINEETIICVYDTSQLDYLNFFTWVSKNVLDTLARAEFLKEAEWKIIEKNPELLVHLKQAAKFAIKFLKDDSSSRKSRRTKMKRFKKELEDYSYKAIFSKDEKQKKFVVLKTGSNSCSNPSEFPNL